MIDLQEWIRDVLERRAITVKRAVRVEGLRNKHLGPRWDYAKVCFLVEPSPRFEVVLGDSLAQEIDPAYLKSALLGFVDVAMTAEPYPIKRIRITVEDAQVDAINSNVMAFRSAGRDAARNLLARLRDEALWVAT